MITINLQSTKTSTKVCRAEAWTLVCRETKLKFNKRVDHTNSIIRPQALGRLRPVLSLT